MFQTPMQLTIFFMTKVKPLGLSKISPLIFCTANQLTGFYMRATLAFNGLNEFQRSN